MTIKVKRIYERPARTDGTRILVDRVWPRGVSRARAEVALWAKEIAPSTGLRRWYGHDPERWPEFRRRYFRELEGNEGRLQEILDHVRSGPVTFVYAAKDEARNNAVALKEFIESEGLAQC